MSILLIEESEEFRNSFVSLLKQEKLLPIYAVGNFKKGFDLLQKKSYKESGEQIRNYFTLILLDINLSEINGLDALKQIKSDSSLCDIPIMILGSIEDVDKMEAAFELGALDFIYKKIRKVELKARIKLVLRLNQEMENRKHQERMLKVLNKNLAEANSHLNRLSRVDPLTSALNRRSFDEGYLKEWRRCMRKKDSLSVIMIDIDYFKLYNDTYGHIEGDHCLKEVANAIAIPLKRESDLLARYGGEEFIVLLSETNLEGAGVVGNHIQKSIAAKNIPHKNSLIAKQVTVSIGIACMIPEPKGNPVELVNNADKALYYSKGNGRNKITIFSEPH
jgi:diguanylate cyclase (GGDEF)-like protein